MNIKKGDNVIMLQGKDRRKKGKVLAVSPIEKKVVVEGLNLVKKHQRPKTQGQKGQIISVERRVDVSSVQLVCPKCNRPTRISHTIVGGNKIRACKKCGAEI